jgi:RecA/RadA recombinase
MSLLEKLKKNSTIKATAILSESTIYGKKDMIQTKVPMINVAMSGSIDGGMTPGLTVIAGPSKHFKTAYSLLLAAAFLDKYKDGVILFYDSEFGTPDSYVSGFGLDPNRIVHSPITNIEELKFDVMQQLDALERKDKVLILIDSIGNLASKKEVDDALDGKSVADMSRAKQLKSLFRMITPHLTIKDIPMVVINHIYMEQGMFPKAIVSGGCLVAGTKIVTEKGLKSVEEIKVGEKVLTSDGFHEVTHTWNPDTLEFGNPPCYEIEFEDGTTIQCSNHHPFLVGDKWIDACDLVEGIDVKHI